MERWENSVKNGTKLRFCTPVQLDEAFLHTAERIVNKYGVISFEGNTYEVDGYLVGKKITIRYNPFHLDYVHVHFDNKYFGTAKIIDLKTEKHKSVGHLEEDPCVDSEISKQYLNSIKSRYQDYLSEQIKLNLDLNKVAIKDSDNCAKDPQKTTDDKSHGFRPPLEIEFSISRKEFLDIIADSFNIDSFTFAEKGKLYELWDTFKDFRKDILTDILSDIKEKSDSCNSNFLYYLTQIKNLYISKLNAEKRKEGDDVNEHKTAN